MVQRERRKDALCEPTSDMREQAFAIARDALEKGALEHRDRDLFLLRLDRWYEDLLQGLTGPYGYGHQLERLVEQLVGLMCRHASERPEKLKLLDLERQLRPDWFQEPSMIGYVCYADRFGGSLRGVIERLDYLEELGVTYLHLMPLLTSRPGENDGGYAVMDYKTVEPSIGTLNDLQELAGELRGRGISLCVDVVINHVAKEHRWARSAQAGDPRFERYFWMFEDRAMPDRYEATLTEVFPDFSPGSFSFDEVSRRWVWTTFNEYQWDLRWENPEVFLEFADIILDLANRGVDVFRLDAVAFMWKREGTDCQNQPEIHALVRALRAVARIVAPSVIFKAEAIVAPRDLIHYLGTGQYHGKVSDLAYHNSLMVHIWSSLASRDTRLMSHALSRFPSKPSSTTWATYLRCHDDIGWAVADEDAIAVGWEGAAHRRFLSDYYNGSYEGSHARGADFQANPLTGDRRTSGSAASLAGLQLGLQTGDHGLCRLAIERLILAHSVILSYDGMPILWMGDELGMINDDSYEHDHKHASDNRWMHRQVMSWTQAERRREQGTMEQRLFSGLLRLIEARKQTPQLHTSSPVVVLAQENPHVFVHVRPHPLGDLVALHNFSEQPQAVASEVLTQRGIHRPLDRISGELISIGNGRLRLTPYARLWLVEVAVKSK